MSIFEKKSLERIIAESESGQHQLKKTLGPVNLVALGIGAIIGAGLFSLTGIAAADHAGPAVVLSFVVAAIGCAFAGMCYSEFSTMIPIAGSAYTYAYATMGELLAWIIGWDLVIEYAIGAATVSVSWSSYVVKLLHRFSIELPPGLTHCPWDEHPGLINLPAVFIIVAVSALLIVGISESARVNAVIVLVKVTIVVIVIFVGYSYVKPENYVPFIPPNTGVMGEFGWSGIMRAAGVIFFAYIGFDAVSTAAQEAKRPQRDMPIGIIGSLAVCTVLYICFARVLTGMVPYRTFHGDAAPVATVISLFPSAGLQTAIYFGIIAGYSSVILVMLLGQSRVFYSMSRDGLLPSLFSFIHPKFQTPSRSNLIVMVFTAILGGFIPISNLSHFTSIGTLLAFVIVCIGIIVMRKTNPNAPRPYRTPLVPLVPILGVLVCFGMMAFLDTMTWLRLGGWLAIGLVIYFGYSRHHSHLRAAVKAEKAR
ncbi:MAG TPA: amino acid permease [Candidatus Sulfopaludibacter sp.]|nr:amino acid permease [Candidatus Sulfopaludibacter sp.]